MPHLLGHSRALQTKVKFWQENFVALDVAAGHQARPAGLFDPLLEAIAAGEEALSGAVDPARRNGPALTGQWGCAAWHLCEAS